MRKIKQKITKRKYEHRRERGYGEVSWLTNRTWQLPTVHAQVIGSNDSLTSSSSSFSSSSSTPVLFLDPRPRPSSRPRSRHCCHYHPCSLCLPCNYLVPRPLTVHAHCASDSLTSSSSSVLDFLSSSSLSSFPFSSLLSFSSSFTLSCLSLFGQVIGSNDSLLLLDLGLLGLLLILVHVVFLHHSLRRPPTVQLHTQVIGSNDSSDIIFILQ